MVKYPRMQTIYNLNLKMLEEVLAEYGQKPYRAKQIYAWLYKKRCSSFEEMTDLPASLIEKLKENYCVNPLKELTRQVAQDGTTKYLFEMQDGSSVEAVLMHFHFGDSLCVSSQIGCNMPASGAFKRKEISAESTGSVKEAGIISDDTAEGCPVQLCGYGRDRTSG